MATSRRDESRAMHDEIEQQQGPFAEGSEAGRARLCMDCRLPTRVFTQRLMAGGRWDGWNSTCFGCSMYNRLHSRGGAARPVYHAIAAGAAQAAAARGGLMTMDGAQLRVCVFGGRTDVVTNAKRLASAAASQRRSDTLERFSDMAVRAVDRQPPALLPESLALRVRSALARLQQLDCSRRSTTTMAVIAAQCRRSNGHLRLVELLASRSCPQGPAADGSTGSKRKCTENNNGPAKK
jgi:hypothetical protein